jgi:hypothetical protein
MASDIFFTGRPLRARAAAATSLHVSEILAEFELTCQEDALN